MKDEELLEQLAEKEHASWARWMQYLLFNKCTPNQDGSFTIPADFAERWIRQIETPYAELSEQEKQSDRDEVAHILPIINKHANDKLATAVVKTISYGEIMSPLRKPLQRGE